MKKVLYTDFEGVDDIIASLLENKDIKRAVTRSNLYKFWSKAVDKKFAENSRPYSMINNSVMVIACKNSVVAQELMYRKKEILEKFTPYLKSLKMNVKDFRFDAKKWVD